MGWQQALTTLGPLDWFVAGFATAVSLLGMLLPRIGNFIGRLVLGEDPLLQRWQHARAARQQRIAESKAARRARGKKADKKPDPGP